MNDLQIFNNKEFGKIRTTEINSNAYVCLADVCKILDIKNARDCKTRLNQDGVVTTDTLTKGGKQQLTFINESNLYKVIFQSRKPEAEKFTEWVTNEVLPSIRKNGMYATDELLDNPDLAIKIFEQLKQEREQKNLLQVENEKQSQIIGELKPKADYTDKILQSKGTVKVNVIANDYGLSAQALNKKLHDLGIQYKQGSDWLLYHKYRGKGYTHSKTIHFYRNDGTPDTNINMEWTQKGRLFLYEILKKNGIVPNIEK